jgi:hypothetical protein
MNSKEQHERNLEGFIDMLKTSMSDVDSFRKDDITSYFLMMRKFFKDYVDENNEMYEVESPLFIASQEARNIQCFFNRMIEIFDKSNSVEFICGMTVLDNEILKKFREYQLRQFIDMESIRRQQSELVAAYSNRMEELLREIEVKK